MKRNFKLFLIVFAVTVFLVLSFLLKPQMEYSVHIEGVMDTSADITVITSADGSGTIAEISDIISKYDDMFSHTESDSEIYKLNQYKKEKISKETYDIIKKCEEFYINTEGSYDITVGKISELWNDTFKTGILPDSETIENALKEVGYENLNFTENEIQINNNLKINLGSVAKGYTTDKIKEYLDSENLKDALINFGGNIYARGKNKNGEEWNIGVQDPLSDEELLLSLKISDKFVITSGNYIRYADINNKRYHHIIDANTGYPVQNELNSVTIVSDSGFLGDALSTACFLSGYYGSKKLLEDNKAGAVFVTKDNKVYYSKELENSLNIISEKYEYIPF